jgi:hypothetical protein
MTTRELTRTRGTTFEAEGGGWLVLRRPQPGLLDTPPADLLARAKDLPGNFRYVPQPDGGVHLLGEVRSLAAGATLDHAQERLAALLDGPPDGGEPTADVLEAALEASGLAWARREKGWAVPANDRLPRELHVGPTPTGLRVEAVLAEWDEITPAEREALALFLATAQAGLRGARCEMDGRGARVVAVVEAAQVDTELTCSLLAVAVACRQLARPAAALLVPEVAAAFLDFHKPPASSQESGGSSVSR